MSGNDVQIKVSDLTMAYGDFVLLKDASFEVRKQDIFIIMGAQRRRQEQFAEAADGTDAADERQDSD